MTRYHYLGDRMTDPALKGQLCSAVLQPNGKCIRGKNGSMLVEFDSGRKAVVIGRLLRKVKEPTPDELNRIGYIVTTASGHSAHVLASRTLSPKTIEALQTVIELVVHTPIGEFRKQVKLKS